jgi:seryl-tRNA synthetase
MTPISWNLVAKALDLYQNLGYKYVEAPWVVSPEATRATIPEGLSACGMQYDGQSKGDLVGSAEQGFAQLMIDGAIGPGRWVAAGPCFRWEAFDTTHQMTFFKVELIEIARKPLLEDMITDASRVLYKLTGHYPEMVKTPEGYDLEVNGVEVGSYGLRSFKDVTWAYGTGLALPRTTNAVR